MDGRDTFLSVVVPAYNEESRLETPIPHVVEYFNSRFNNWELIYVNDGSTDQTHTRLLELEKLYPALRIVNSEKNEGKGSAVKKGMYAARGDLTLFSDTDFSTPVEETEKLFAEINAGYDIVIASRGLERSEIEVHQAWFREEMGKIFNLILRSMLPLEFQDTQCGFKMFTRKAAEVILPKLTISGFAFDVEMLTIAQVHGFRIAEVPVIWRDVLHSKVHPLRNSSEMLRDVLKIRYKLLMNAYS